MLPCPSWTRTHFSKLLRNFKFKLLNLNEPLFSQPRHSIVKLAWRSWNKVRIENWASTSCRCCFNRLIIWDSSVQEICFFSSIYSIIYLYQYGLMAIYFVFWVITQFFSPQIVSALAIGSSFSWLLCSFGISVMFVCESFQYFLIFWHYRMLQAPLVYFLSQN